MLSLLSTESCGAARDKILQNEQMVDEQMIANVSDGLDHVAHAYGMEPGSAAFALAAGFRSQQALQSFKKRGGGRNTTWDAIRRNTKVSIDWLRYRSGKDFPEGKNPNLRAGKTPVAELERDIDALRNLVIAMSTVLAKREQGVGVALIQAIEEAPYSDRGIYEIVTKAILEASPEVSPAVGQGEAAQLARKRR